MDFVPEFYRSTLTLYDPRAKDSLSLSELFTYSASATFFDSSVWCGKCGQKTNHTLAFEQSADILIVEIIRVTQKKRRNRLCWRKNKTPISFPTTGISIPGTQCTYRVITTSHHYGTLDFGHWTTKLLTRHRSGLSAMI